MGVESVAMEVTRIPENPIVHPGTDGVPENVNGPSLVRAPPWVDDPLGEYYLYFADHGGDRIHLAYADDLSGPWRVREGGVLSLSETGFDDHVASPDVHVDEAERRVRLYYHGCCGTYREGGEEASQFTRLAVSTDGLRFESRPEKLGRFYFRVFEHDGAHYALAKHNRGPDQEESGIAVYRSADGLSGFERGGALRWDGARHTAVRVRGDTLDVFYSRIGDAPERILHAAVDLTDDWREWSAPDPEPVLEPTADYEGANEPIRPSELGAVHDPVCQVRDPAIFEEGEKTYLCYSVAGERGLALAAVTTR